MLHTNKHDRYVQRLYDRIKDDYDAVERNVVFSSRKCRKCMNDMHFRACSQKCALATCAQAEADIIAYRGDEVHVYEVKCSYRFAKAKKQLLKVLRLLKRPAVAYFYCGSADRLEIIAKAMH